MTGFIVRVFPFRNRVSFKEAFEGLELGEGKPSRPVLRGPGGRKAAWLLGSKPEMGCGRWLKRLSWKAHELPLRPLRRMANPSFYVVSDQKKHSQLFLGEDPGRWVQTTYVQRS